MFNKIFSFTQEKSKYLYENSLFIKHLDAIILFFILAAFILSLFCSSDTIGFTALIVIFLTILKLFVKKDEVIECKGFEFFLLTYFVIVLISLFGSTLFYLSFKGFLKTCIYMGFYLSLVQYLKTNTHRLKIILYTIAGAIGFESLFAIFQNLLPSDTNSSWQDTSYLMPEEVMTRIYGTLQPYNPNLLAGFLIVGTPILYGVTAYLFAKKYYKSGIFGVFLSLASTWAIICTGCRGAYVALAAVFVGIFLLSVRFFWTNHKKLYLSITGVFCAISAIVILSIQSIRLRFLSIFIMREDSSNSFRFNVYQSALQMLQDNWLLGIGVGNQNFREIYGLYMKTGFDALSAYNIYLEIGVESGIFALLAFLGFLGLMIYQSVKYILNSTDTKNIIIVSMALLSITGVVIHGLVDTVFFRPQIQLIFWLMVAILRTKLYTNE